MTGRALHTRKQPLQFWQLRRDAINALEAPNGIYAWDSEQGRGEERECTNVCTHTQYMHHEEAVVCTAQGYSLLRRPSRAVTRC